jgi:hypothetical protein
MTFAGASCAIGVADHVDDECVQGWPEVVFSRIDPVHHFTHGSATLSGFKAAKRVYSDSVVLAMLMPKAFERRHQTAEHLSIDPCRSPGLETPRPGYGTVQFRFYRSGPCLETGLFRFNHCPIHRAAFVFSDDALEVEFLLEGVDVYLLDRIVDRSDIADQMLHLTLDHPDALLGWVGASDEESEKAEREAYDLCADGDAGILQSDLDPVWYCDTESLVSTSPPWRQGPVDSL